MTVPAEATAPETTDPRVPATADPDDRQRWIALFVLCAGALIIILDSTIVVAALPQIDSALGFSPSGLAWVVNAYLVTFGGLLLLAGRLGDLLGRRRVFVIGLVVFTLASLLCGIAESQATLIAARMLQGVGGALTSAVALGMIVTLFPDPIQRGKAIGVYAFVGAAGASLGLLTGGLLTEVASWHWVFFVNLPIGAITVLAALRWLAPDVGAGLRGGADLPGAVLIVAGVMLSVYTIIAVEGHGWLSAHTLVLGGLSAVLLAGFVVREQRASQPLVPLRLFRIANVAAANLLQVLAIAGIFGQQFFVALYLQRVLGYDPLTFGLAFLPTPFAIGAVALGASARLNARFGPKAVLVAGLGAIAIGLALLGRVPVDGRYVVDVLPPLLLLGLGGGLVLPAISTLAMSGTAADDAGLASGLANTTQQIGAALGLAILATVSASRTDSLAGGSMPDAAALTGGYRVGFLVAAGLTVAAIGVAAAALRSPHAVDEPARAGA